MASEHVGLGSGVVFNTAVRPKAEAMAEPILVVFVRSLGLVYVLVLLKVLKLDPERQLSRIGPSDLPHG